MLNQAHLKLGQAYCQAQPQLQVKLSLKAELALILVSPATHPHSPPGKVYFEANMNLAKLWLTK